MKLFITNRITQWPKRFSKVCAAVLLSFCLKTSASPTPKSPVFNNSDVYWFDLQAEIVDYDLKNSNDLRRYYDTVFLVSSLQGLVNRDSPRLYVNFLPETDAFWFEKMRAPNQWLSQSKLHTISGIDALLEEFSNVFQGYAIYDETVPATSNAAATIAGIKNLLVLRYDPSPSSLYTKLTGVEPDSSKDTIVRLIQRDGSPLFTGKGTIPGTDLPSTGSAKNDVYRAIIELYLKTGEISTDHLGYYLDAYWLNISNRAEPQNHTLTNLDFIIAKRGMVFDLHFEEDEVPMDDPNQKLGTDFKTVTQILRGHNEQSDGRSMMGLHGYTPWVFKYTNHPGAGGKKHPVAVEHRTVRVASAYNFYVDADAPGFSAMTNASFFMHFKLPKTIPQTAAKPTERNLIEQGALNSDGSLKPVIYYAHYAGDYDSAGWLYNKMPEIWSDPARGNLPITWPINPNLAERFAFGLWWIRNTATENDVFVAGDSGAGYINPYQLSEPREFSNLPSGVARWEDWNRKWFRQFDLDTVGFVIDGTTPFMKDDALKAYLRFAPAGLGTQAVPPKPVVGDTPLLRVQTYFIPGVVPNFMKDAISKVLAQFKRSQEYPRFLTFRSVLWKPSDFVELEKQIDAQSKQPRILVDQRTLLWLSRRFHQGAR